MSGIVLTASARCQDSTCGWACEGEPAEVERAARHHLKEHPFAVSTVVVPDDPAPRRKEAQA